MREVVYVRAHDADGTPRTDAIRVDTAGSGRAVLPEVFVTANGGFQVVFGIDRENHFFDELHRRQFDRDGDRIGRNELVNVDERDVAQFLARSAMLANGRTVTIWNSERSFSTAGQLDNDELRGTITDRSGEPTRSEFHLTIDYGTIGSRFG